VVVLATALCREICVVTSQKSASLRRISPWTASYPDRTAWWGGQATRESHAVCLPFPSSFVVFVAVAVWCEWGQLQSPFVHVAHAVATAQPHNNTHATPHWTAVRVTNDCTHGQETTVHQGVGRWQGQGGACRLCPRRRRWGSGQGADRSGKPITRTIARPTVRSVCGTRIKSHVPVR
jgi:hypothetical protein